MHGTDWIGYLIPGAIILFTLLRGGGRAVRRGSAALGAQAAGVRQGMDQLRQAVEEQQRLQAIAEGRVSPSAPPDRPTAPAPPPPPPAPAAPRAAVAPSAAVAPPPIRRVTPIGGTPVAAVPAPGGRSLQAAFATAASAQQAFILAEILAPPVAFR